MPKKKTYEEIKHEFIKQEVILLWTEEEFKHNYKNVDQKIPIICKCGDKDEKSYRGVQNGQKCMKCGNIKKGLSHRKSYQQLLNECEKQEVIFEWTEEEYLKNYVDNKTKFPIICKCGDKDEKSFNKLNKGQKCLKCKFTKMKETNIERHGFEYASQSDEIKDKMKQTNLEKYGVENPGQSEEIKDKMKKTNLEKYGFEYASQSEEIRDKIEETNLERYGFKNPTQSDEVKNKTKKTNLEKYGVEYPLQLPEIKDKIKKTNLEKYGVEYPLQLPEIRDKIEETNLEIYGVKNCFSSEEIKDKIKKTNLEKYGVEYPMQNSEISSKSSSNAYKTKNYILPSGNIIRIQGYEHFALDELIYKENVKEEDILVSRIDVPEIWYLNPKDNKKHRYFTDIYIKSQNKCIEVKSSWTNTLNVDKILLKEKASIEEGYLYELRVYDAKGNKIFI